MIASGSNIEIVQACLHHSSADTTSTIYAHVRDQRLREGVQAYRAGTGTPASGETAATAATAALVDQVVAKVLDRLGSDDLVERISQEVAGRLVAALASKVPADISTEIVSQSDGASLIPSLKMPGK